jgi:hypothetical protein
MVISNHDQKKEIVEGSRDGKWKKYQIQIDLLGLGARK